MALSASKKAFLPAIIVCSLTAIVIMRFGAIILVLIIMPMIMAYLLDQNPRKPMFKIISATNLAAAIPFIVPIIKFSLKRQYTEVGLVMENPMSWLFIYVGAASGWAMIQLAKFVSRVFTLMHYEYSIGVLEKRQQALLEEWGEGIKPS